MKLDILGGSYKQKYADLSTQRTLNLYPVIFSQVEHSKVQIALYPTPGLTQFASLAGIYPRGIFTARTVDFTRCFAVRDNKLYEIFINGSSSLIGTMDNMPIGNSPIWFECNGNNEVFIGQYTASYVFDMDTNVLTQITDNDFPNNIKSATYIDGYLLVVSGGRVYFSDVNSFLNWTGSQVFTPTLKADPVIGVVAYKDKVYCFGSETIEPYFEDGSAAVFARYPGASLNTGARNARCISAFDDGVIFVSGSRNGQSQVNMISNENSSLQSISIKDPSIQYRINSIPEALSEAWSTIQKTKTGEAIYRLTIPALKTTFCYNIYTGYWFEQQSVSPSLDFDGSYIKDIFRGVYVTNFNDRNIFLDLYTSDVLVEDYTSHTEVGQFIERQRVSQIFYDPEDHKNICSDLLEVDVTRGIGTLSSQGSSPVMMVDVSHNGGRIYESTRNMLLGEHGDYTYRARLKKLGMGRDWVISLTVTDPLDLMIQNAWAKGSVSSY